MNELNQVLFIGYQPDAFKLSDYVPLSPTSASGRGLLELSGWDKSTLMETSRINLIPAPGGIIDKQAEKGLCLWQAKGLAEGSILQKYTVIYLLGSEVYEVMSNALPDILPKDYEFFHPYLYGDHQTVFLPLPHPSKSNEIWRDSNVAETAKLVFAFTKQELTNGKPKEWKL